MILTLQIIGLIFMLVVIFLAIWAFVIANNAYSQLKYQNYLLEKLVQSIHTLANKSLNNDIKTNFEENINEDIGNSKNFNIERVEKEELKN